ncbi:hypothetical protein B0H63DRAFT_256848 [Podospora didyma]|uniref:DUF7719 domain-containing protein n=1 Tax=Podospora didyma TaxID=330526 RepID=A0AAE0KER6_9PEZI|nr:hypothetical protein B0H63DRAFT_256848 [Podospora didyma]
MAKKRKDESAANIKLQKPDRSGPTEQTLLQMAEARGLFAQAQEKEDANKKAARRTNEGGGVAEPEDDEWPELSATTERILDTLLWTVSLAMLHFTFDVLVQHQYSADRIVWPSAFSRAGQAFLVFALLFYPLHPHASNPTIIPGIPTRFQPIIRQAIFFWSSITAGCYLIHITNTYGYLAVMKQAPSVGCIWVWSVIELDLPWAVLSLVGAGSFLWQRGYSIK